MYIVSSTSTRQPAAQLLNVTGIITTFTQVFMQYNEIIYSKEYYRVKTRNSYTVAFRVGRNTMFGQILYFVVSHNQ